MYQVALNLVEHGTLDIHPEIPAIGPNGEIIPYGAYGADGKFYSKYGLGTSLAMIPLIIFGKLLTSFGSFSISPYFLQLTASWLNMIVTALAGTTFYLIGVRLGFSLKTALTLTLIFGFSLVWPYTKTTFSEPLTMLFLLLAVYAGLKIQREIKWRWIAFFSFCLGAAILTRITALVFLPFFYLFLLTTQKQAYFQTKSSRVRYWFVALAPLLGMLLLVAWYNAFRFGTPWNLGYETDNWQTFFFTGLYGLLLSPGKGLIWYFPLIVLSPFGFWCFSRRQPEVTNLFLGLVTISILFHAPYTYWEGGSSWGPRLLLPIIPYFLLPLGCLIDREPVQRGKIFQSVLAMLLASSIIVQIPVVIADYSRHLQTTYQRNPQDFDFQTKFSWEGSPLLGQWRSMLTITSNTRQPEVLATLKDLVQDTAKQETNSGTSISNSIEILAVNVPDFWFVYFPLLDKVSSTTTHIILIIQIGAVVFLGYLLKRLFKDHHSTVGEK